MARKTVNLNIPALITADTNAFDSEQEKESKLQIEYEDAYSHSISFSILQYPLLLVIYLALTIDLIFYFLFRFIVFSFEYLTQSFVESRALKQDLSCSKTFKEWKEIAMKLDDQLGHSKWKAQLGNSFDEQLVRKTTRKLQSYNENDNLDKLMSFLVNSACKNDLGGIEAEGMYSKCYYGTKDAINHYVNQVKLSLDKVGVDKSITNHTKAHFFKSVSRVYGRTALCLSGGAQLGWFHLGMIKALFEQKLLPQIFTGTSAGSMIAAAVCVRKDSELHELFDKKLAERINCCEETIEERIRNLWNTGAIFKNQDFLSKAGWWTKGDTTFLEAFKRTGRILNITVMSQESHSKLKVLNYINTPDVTIRSASVASSAVPGIIQAGQLFMKKKDGKVVPYLSAGKLWRDGSMISDIPEREIQQLFRVTHTIVSQVNPHISLFFYKPTGGAGCPSLHRYGKGWRGGFILTFLVRLFLLDIHKWLNLIRDTKLLPRIMGSNFSNLWLQSFEGNVTILPEFQGLQLLKVVTDPNEDELEEFIHQGELRTWPKILMISNQVRIEQTIGHWLKKFERERIYRK